jgi:hypothetical protein
VAALLPVTRPYLRVARERGGRPAFEIFFMLPRWNSWATPAPASVLWSRWQANADALPMRHEHALFLGALPSGALLAAAACCLGRGARGPRCFVAAGALAFAAVFLLTLYTDPFCLYLRLLTLPGVSAFRAVGRVALVLGFPAAAALAYLLTALPRGLDRALGPLAPGVAALLLPLVVADQAVRRDGLSASPKRLAQQRAGRIAERVRRQDPRARLLLNLGGFPEDAFTGVSYKGLLVHVDGMMAAQLLGIPTLNGYSGWEPRDYDVFWTHSDVEDWVNGVRRRVGEERLRERPWYERHGVEGLAVVGRLRDAGGRPRTRSTGPLPEEGYRCRLEARPLPAVVEAGGTFPFVVRVANEGTVPWPALGTVNVSRLDLRIGLAYRWLTPDGREVVPNDVHRTYLPHDIPPGGAVDLDGDVTAPGTPGYYLLEFSLLHENARPFADPHHPPLHRPISVVPRQKPALKHGPITAARPSTANRVPVAGCPGRRDGRV